MKAETGHFKVTPLGVSAKVKRGDKSNSYFIITYNVLLTLFIGAVSLIPNEIIYWYVKIFLIFILALFLYYICFRVDKFRNFVVGIFSDIENYEETSR